MYTGWNCLSAGVEMDKIMHGIFSFQYMIDLDISHYIYVHDVLGYIFADYTVTHLGINRPNEFNLDRTFYKLWTVKMSKLVHGILTSYLYTCMYSI